MRKMLFFFFYFFCLKRVIAKRNNDEVMATPKPENVIAEKNDTEINRNKCYLQEDIELSCETLEYLNIPNLYPIELFSMIPNEQLQMAVDQLRGIKMAETQKKKKKTSKK
jgi:hypothetical protein